jgi:hypothetical protein
MKGKIPKGATEDEWVEGLSPEQSAINRELRKIIRNSKMGSNLLVTHIPGEKVE